MPEYKLIDRRKEVIDKYCETNNTSIYKLGKLYSGDKGSLYSMLSKASNNPELITVLRLCKLLNCKVEDLFELK